MIFLVMCRFSVRQILKFCGMKRMRLMLRVRMMFVIVLLSSGTFS